VVVVHDHPLGHPSLTARATIRAGSPCYKDVHLKRPDDRLLLARVEAAAGLPVTVMQMNH
jgi:hypothetical protein